MSRCLDCIYEPLNVLVAKWSIKKLLFLNRLSFSRNGYKFTIFVLIISSGWAMLGLAQVV